MTAMIRGAFAGKLISGSIRFKRPLIIHTREVDKEALKQFLRSPIKKVLFWPSNKVL